MATTYKCPMDKPQCVSECKWHMDGECAVFVIAKSLSDLVKIHDKSGKPSKSGK